MENPLILVIDDDRFFLESVQEVLELEGYQVVSSDKGADGIRLAQSHRPDLIICDLMMPNVDGYGVLLAIRENPQTQTIPIILLASKGSQPDIWRMRTLSADDFLTKPFTAEELLVAVDTSLRNRIPPPPAEAPPDFANDDPPIRFLVSNSEVLVPGSEHPLLGYVFLEPAQQKVLHDAYDYISANDLYFPSDAPIQENSVTAVPRIPGFVIEPERITHEFQSAWHRFDFTIFAPQRLQTGFGSIDFYFNGIIAASINLTINVGEDVQDVERRYEVVEPFRHVYCSYSPNDKSIADHIKAATRMPSHAFLRDVHALRSGRDFSDDNLYLIEQADAFQLFWSEHAAESGFMEQEWQYALALDEKPPTFIRPVYWEDPFNADIPPELRPIHFSFLPIKASHKVSSRQFVEELKAASRDKPARSSFGEQVLVVDDEIGALTLIEIMLGRGGFEIAKAKTGEAALETLDTISPALIIVDSHMPGMDGPTLIGKIRARAKTRQTPILLLAARGDAEAILKGMESGANDYLPKPILHHDLVAKVREMLAMD